MNFHEVWGIVALKRRMWDMQLSLRKHYFWGGAAAGFNWGMAFSYIFNIVDTWPLLLLHLILGTLCAAVWLINWSFRKHLDEEAYELLTEHPDLGA
jgi:hypothetical protein